MANIWRKLNNEEMMSNNEFKTKVFGTFKPNFIQKFLISFGQKTFLKRGIFRGTYTTFIMLLSKGPLDIIFRNCAYRIWGEHNLIEYGLLLNPNYNSSDLNFLTEQASLDDNFVDIGSNIGLYSQPMALAAPKGKTISIDANPLMATRLKFNANASRLSNLEMVSSAVSDINGVGSLIIRKNDVAIVAVNESADEGIQIRTLSSILDEKKIMTIYGLKIDIEGHEDKALVPFLMNAPKKQLPKRIVIEKISQNDDYPGCKEAFDKLNYKLIGRSRNNSFYKLV